MAKHKYTVLNTSRWESATITEWILYYASIGFDHIYIYCNDDEPDEMYAILMPFLAGPHPFVTFHHLPFQGQQEYCWLHFLENHKDETEWFFFVDADEFLALKECDDIHTFMQSRENRADCINFNWIWFGPQYFDERPAGSTLLQFTLREDHRRQMNYFTKSLTRSSTVDSRCITRPVQPMINHFWPQPIQDVQRSINVLDYPFASYNADHPAAAIAYLNQPGIREQILNVACTYHYLFRSRKDFRRRVERGLNGAYYFQSQWGRVYESGNLEDFVQTLNAVEDRYLADYWRAYLRKGSRHSLIEKSCYRNLARDSWPTQSSTCQWSKHPDKAIDARGAINGIHSGTYGFHTDLEDQPWWATDLRGDWQIREIRIFNCLKAAETAIRSADLITSLSDDGQAWRIIDKREDSTHFGGVDGNPYVIHLNDRARYVKFSLPHRDFFHLDEIEIYGHPP